MDGCEVKGCLQFNTKAVTALSFPEDPALRSQWIQFCGRQKSWTPEKFAKICSVHFKDRDFTLEHNESVPTKKLKDGSIPSVSSNISNLNRNYIF